MHAPDLDLDTESALDIPAMRQALAEGARTSRGRRAALAIVPWTLPEPIRRAFDALDEVRALEADAAVVPVGGIEDVEELVDLAGKGAVLEKADLRRCGESLWQLDHLGSWLEGEAEAAPVLFAHARDLRLDDIVVGTLRDAFDATGDLSASSWPILGELRERVAGLHAAIRRTLDQLVSSDAMADVLQERFVTQRGDRYVIPVKVNFKRKDMGIVHAMSASGQTAFVEPAAVVELNNDLRLAEGALDAEERRILTDLSRMLGRIAGSVRVALVAATEVDLACARASLVDRLRAVRPAVGRDGVVSLRSARHPVLTLRGVDVVPNDLRLDGSTPALVISGPNTGGKTIALKTIGLSAWLVRVGCFVPADEGSRVDLFSDVVARIGDHQSVHGDQSSFSAHLVALGEMLRRARPGALFLVDEIASGTDPHQGAALAIAVVERWLDAGVRCVITTHFQRLKTLGTTDPRVATAGMEFAGGRPTWRMVPGARGESHALEVALRTGFDPAVVRRAEALLEVGERSLADALAALDREQAHAAEAAREVDALRRVLKETEARVAAREAAVDARARALEQERAAGFSARLAAAEKAIAAVVADLQRAPSHDKVTGARATVDALRGLVPTDPVAPATPDAPTLKVGDRVRLSLGEVGEVVELGRQYGVRTSRGLVLRVAPADLTPLPKGAPVPRTTPRAKPKGGARASDDAVVGAVRTDANTLDLRGQRVEEGLEEVERFLARMIEEEYGTVFFLHGHGTGAMKLAVRRFLATSKIVSSWRPAGADQGGDAYSVASLKL